VKVFRVIVVPLLISYNTMKAHGKVGGITTVLTLAPLGQEWSGSQPIALPTYPPDRKLYNLINKANLVHNFSLYVYFFSLHVSGDYMPSSGDITVSM